MKHLFVPEEIAVLAKGKGFSEPCLAFYTYNSGDPYLIMYQHESHPNVVSAPLYQQIIDWLDEKKIIISIEYAAPDSNNFRIRIDNYNTESFGDYLKGKDGDTWTSSIRRKAMNKAIKEALKLIS